MKFRVGLCACLLVVAGNLGRAASKPHTVTLGKWLTIKLSEDDQSTETSQLKIRPVIVDGRNKEWTMGPMHDVTERTFVVQRVYRLNDTLPQESGVRWRWELGGWLLVDRISAKVQAVNLPAFDPYSSQASWFRDYAAYCGTSDDGKKQFALVMHLGRRKPLLKKILSVSPAGGDVCPSPKWDRDPARVAFAPKNDAAFTYTVRSHALDAATMDEEKDEDEE